MQDVICFYHKDCFDGLGAAYAVYRKYPDAKFIPIHYGDKVWEEDCVGKDIIVVDFSFSLVQSLALIEVAKSFTVLDHHKTFAPVAAELQTRMERGEFEILVTIVYDLNRSGALITWEHLHSEPAPRLTQIISECDLWRFTDPHVKPIMAYVGLTPYSLEAYADLYDRFDANYGTFLLLGETIRTKIDQDADNIIRTSRRTIRVGGHDVPLVNAPYFLASDVLAKLAQEYPYAISYYDTEEERVFSIRSAPDSEHDVEVIAKTQGGGGHKHAAGWRTRRYSNLAQL